MHNSSDQLYNDEHTKRASDSYQASLNSQKNEPKQPQSRPRNQISNIAIKPNGISGTYARIIPKRPIHDYEQLYNDNMQLREKIKSLEDVLMKTKTRMSMVEREKDQILQQLKADSYSVLTGQTKPGNKILQIQNSSLRKKGQNEENRRILHEYKDKIKSLEEENARLKKTVKYTQIQQLETQNLCLHEEMLRLKENMEDIINNTEYEQYQKEIQNLNKLLQSEKDQIRSMHQRLKKKDEQLEELKQKMRGVVNRKTDLERRYNREMNNLKGQLFRSKEKQKEFFQQQAVQQKKQSSKSFHAARYCGKCLEHKKTIENLITVNKSFEKGLKDKSDEITKLNHKIQMLSKDISLKATVEVKKQSEPFQGNTYKSDQETLVQKQRKKEESIPIQVEEEKNQQIKDKDESIKKTNKISEPSQRQSVELDDEDYNDAEQFQSEDKIDMLHVNMKRKTQQQAKKEENYEEQFNELREYQEQPKENESQEEMLFQKQDRKESKQSQRPKAPKKSKEKSKIKEKGQKQSKHKEDGKNIVKQEKILHETIRYRLIGQRYTFKDFERDITDSGATEFGIQDIIEMLTNQPFLLHEEHLEMVLAKCFQKKEFDENDSLATSEFMKKIKPMFEGVKLLGEEEEKIITDGIRKKLKKKGQIIYEGLETEGTGNDISKKAFVKILSDLGKLNQEEIQQCLSEVSVLSKDIAHINYPAFMQTMLQETEG